MQRRFCAGVRVAHAILASVPNRQTFLGADINI
jgi:hypothetical protein